MKKIKLFISDIDGTLTDGGMYYSPNGEFLKKFNTKDGHGFQILKEHNILTAVITSELSEINHSRFSDKLNLDFVIEGKKGVEKLISAKKIISKLNISLDEVAYIGDDVNCHELLSAVKFKACPNDANQKIKKIPGIIIMKEKGGNGCVREFIDSFIF